MTYPHNIYLWLTGFSRLGTLAYKPGWNAWKFLPVYLIDPHNLLHVWRMFPVSTELYMGGTYEGYQSAGSTPGAHVVTAGAWTGRTESLTVLNQ